MPPSDPRPGQDVIVTATWSTFRGRRGTIKSVAGEVVMVLLEGEEKEMRIESCSFDVIVGGASAPNLTGAE